jgi:hypothetical protein
MAADAYKNLAIATVATAPSPAASGTSLVVTAGQGARFPTPPFNATVWPATALPDPTTAEIVRVTAIATDTLTLVRAQEGTTARTILVGDLFAATVTKKLLDDLNLIDPAEVTNAMLAGSITANKLVATDITTVGTLTAGATGAGFTIALGASTVTGTLADARLSANVLTAAGGYPGGTTTFLRADGTFAVPAGGAPAAHATTHKSGGSDPIALDTLAAPTDIATLNASSSAHGLLPKLSGTTTTFLRGDGTWVAPGGGGDVTGPASSTTDAVAVFSSATGKVIRNSSAIYDGGGNLFISANLYFSTLIQMTPLASGVLRLANQLATDFNRLTFGGASNAFPALKRSSAMLICRLADDTADAVFRAAGLSTTPLDATQLTTGTIPDARLSANIPRLNTANTFTQAQTITGPSLAIGTTPAQSGALRLANDGEIQARNYNNNADQRLIASSGFDVLVGNFATTTYIDSIGNINLRGIVVATGFGTHTFSAGGTGGNLVGVRNTAAGPTNFACLRVGNDLTAGAGLLTAVSSTWTPTTDIDTADSFRVAAYNSGGLGLSANHVSGVIRFYTAGGATERMSIRADGDVWIGTSNVVSGNLFAVLAAGRFNLGNPGTAAATAFAFYNANGQVGTIQTSGSATSYNTSSDQRLKTDRGLATDLTALQALRVHDFIWTSHGTRDRGIFAQEAYPIFPRAITPGTDAADLSRRWMTDYSKFVPDLIVGWQQHEATIQTLLDRIAALERN